MAMATRVPSAAKAAAATSCPYLDTIDRTALDFDSTDRACSVTLESSPHIYACLVCGKFYRGRGSRTPAYTHSVEEGHFVYVHLAEGTFWCLPDGYRIDGEDPSLRDIRLALRPSFTEEEVAALDDNQELARDLFGRRYLPGFVGLNNLNRTDYVNAVVQALSHVGPLRDFFLLAPNHDGGSFRSNNDVKRENGSRTNGHSSKKRKSRQFPRQQRIPYSEFSPLAKSFSLLLRNMWSPHRFKSNVDPHLLVQAVSVASNKRYHVGRQAEAGEFLAWLLHQLHIGTGGSVKPGKRRKKKGGGGIIYDTFMGRVETTTVTRRRRRRGEAAAMQMLEQGGMEAPLGEGPAPAAEDAAADEDDRAGSDDDEAVERRRKKRETLRTLAEESIVAEEEAVTDADFLQLTLDIPEKPLFKDEDGGLVIPQEPLVNVLRKFDGVSFTDALAMQQQKQVPEDGGEGTVVSKRRRYRLRKLPGHLILHLSRFRRNGFFVEKNPTIVMFPVKNFDLSSYVFPEGGREKGLGEEEVRAMSTKELKNLLVKYGRGDLANSSIEKNVLLQHCIDFVTTSLPDLLADKYDLVANITHDIPVEVGREGTQRNPLEEGTYRCHVRHGATGKWYEMQDLNVRETMPQLIGVSESYLLVFERKGAPHSSCR